MIKYEIKIQADLGDGHVNLVQAKGVVLTHSHLCIVMEYASGGNLTAYVTDKWDTVASRNGLFLSEDESRYFVHQYFNAVEYLHQNHVAHRDLKLDNIVLDARDPPRIKVCDFGFAKNWDDHPHMHTQIGTPVYMSPELINSRKSKKAYDATKADVWACGVLLFVMLLGMFPFEHEEHPDPNSSEAHVEVWLQQIKCNWRMNPRVAPHASKLSEQCRDLLDKMFELDEKRRITVEGVKAHPWLNKPLPAKLKASLNEIAADQAKKDDMVAQGYHKSDKRDEALMKLLEMSGSQASPGEKSTRIDFSRIKASYSILETGIPKIGGQLTTIMSETPEALAVLDNDKNIEQQAPVRPQEITVEAAV